MPMSDNEQVQQFKAWWKQYGSYILFAVLAFSVSNFGWRYWVQYKERHLERASTSYMQTLVAFEQQKYEEVDLYAKHLITDYPSSPYASLAAFLLAKVAVQKNDLKQAQEQLQLVVKKSSSDTLRQIARVRLARIMLAEKQPQKALDLLKKIDDKAYSAEVSELCGDAWMQLGNKEEAKKSYQQAKVALTGEAKSPLLELKLRQF